MFSAGEMVSTLAVFSAMLALVFAKPVARNMKVHESRSYPAAGFVRTGPAAANTTVRLRIALVQSNPERLIDALYNVSTPGSPSYGQHLSKAEVEALVAPSTETVSAVEEWLQQAGINATKATAAGDWLSIAVPVSKANELLDADFNVYTHTVTGQQVIRTMRYSVPPELEGHLDFVYPTVSFPNPRSRTPLVTTPLSMHRSANNATPTSGCLADGVTPACVYTLYHIPTSVRGSQSSNKLAVSGFIEQFANQNDLATFLHEFRPDLPGQQFALQTLDGGRNPQKGSQAGIEANLDIQYAVGIASGVPVTFISVGEQNHDGALGGFLDIINALLNENHPPQVLSTSYGEDEPDISPALASKLCNAYAQLGARGTSILFSSGDGGVSGSSSQSCSKFVPTFPSGCPFMTSVGATALTSSAAAHTETAANFSSGGFSDIFAAPSYQASAVQTYLAGLGSANKGKFNPAGRAYPDVAAIGHNLGIVVDGELQGVDGTSCSTPIFASIVSLINDELIGNGKSPLGFLNPFLYANPQAFFDVTTGDNPGCGTNGFPASKGWDPVTGLGTPNFPALRAAAGL